MTRRPGSTENLHIRFNQASEKAAEWALRFEISCGIFFEDPHAALSTEIIAPALVFADHRSRIVQAYLHATYRVWDFIMRVDFHHNRVLPVPVLFLPWQRHETAREEKRFVFLKWWIAV